MRRAELEEWVLNIVDKVKNGQWTEDSRVELKAQWPDDAYRAARRIAGHANAARGDSILWIIGIDESRNEVSGAGQGEMATWWQKVALSDGDSGRRQRESRAMLVGC